MQTKNFEQRAMKLGILANIIMAISGIYVFYLTKMEALFLDGAFSFISAISCIVAIWISKESGRKSKIFPRGHFIFEPLYAILKSAFTLFLLLSATSSSISKIFLYVTKGVGEKIQTGPILIYTVLMIIICFGLAGVYMHYNKKIGNMSIILKSETKASFIDGILSAGIGVAVIVLNLIDSSGALGFMQYIGDSIISIIFIVLSIKAPIMSIKDSFIELANGVVVDNNITQPISEIVKQYIPKFASLKECRVRKVGTSFSVNVYLIYENEEINLENYRKAKDELQEKLSGEYENIALNFIPV